MKIVLEDRFLFDASLARTTHHVDNTHHDNVKTASAEPKNIVFIDSRISNISTLLNGLKPDTKAIKVDVNKDGLKEITNVLKNEKNINSISIVGYGENDKLQLGNTLITDATTKDNNDVASWGNAMTANGQIYLFGCDVGHDSNVVKNIDIDTHHDTFASDTRIGNGTWVVEDLSGKESTFSPFTEKAIKEYSGYLDLTDASLTTSYGSSSDTHNDQSDSGTAFVPGVPRAMSLTINLAPNETISNSGNDLVVKEYIPSYAHYLDNSFSITTSSGVQIDSSAIKVVKNNGFIEFHIGKDIVNTTNSIGAVTIGFSNYLGAGLTEGERVSPVIMFEHDGKTLTSGFDMVSRSPSITPSTPAPITANNYSIGNNVGYTFTLNNSTGIDAYNVKLFPQISGNLTNVVIVDEKGNKYTDMSNVNVGEIPAGTIKTFTVTGKIGNNLSADTGSTISFSSSFNGNSGAVVDNTIPDSKTSSLSYLDANMTSALGLDKVGSPTMTLYNGVDGRGNYVIDEGEEVTAGHDYSDYIDITNNASKTLYNPFVEVFMPQKDTENGTLNYVKYGQTNLDYKTSTVQEVNGVLGAYEPLSSNSNNDKIFVKAPDGYQAGDLMYSFKVPLTSMVNAQGLKGIELNYHVNNTSETTSYSGKELHISAVSGYLTGDQPVFNVNSEMIRGNSISTINATSDQYSTGIQSIDHRVNLVDVYMSPYVVTNESKTPSSYGGSGYAFYISPGSQTETNPVTNYNISFKIPDGATYDPSQGIATYGFLDGENPQVTVKDGYVNMHFDKLSFEKDNKKQINLPLIFSTPDGHQASTIYGPDLKYTADDWTYLGKVLHVNGDIDNSMQYVSTMPFSVFDTSYDESTLNQYMKPGGTFHNSINVTSSPTGYLRNAQVTSTSDDGQTVDPNSTYIFRYSDSYGNNQTLTFNLDKSTIKTEQIAGQTIYTSGSGDNMSFSRDPKTGITTYNFNFSGELKSETGRDQFGTKLSGYIVYTNSILSRYTVGDLEGQPLLEGHRMHQDSSFTGEFGEGNSWAGYGDYDSKDRYVQKGQVSVDLTTVNGKNIQSDQDKATDILAGSDITYKTTYHLGTGNYNTLRLVNYLPASVFNVGNPETPSSGTMTGLTEDASGVWSQSVDGKTVGTYSLVNAPDGVKITSVGVDPTTNAITFYISGKNDMVNNPTDISIVYTLKSTSIISRSDIPVNVQAVSFVNYDPNDANYSNAYSTTALTTATLDQPFVFQRTGIVAVFDGSGKSDSNVKYTVENDDGTINNQPNADPTTVYSNTNSDFVSNAPTSITGLQDLDASSVTAGDTVRVATSVESGLNGASGNVYDLVVKGSLPSNISPDLISNLKIVRSDGEVMSFTKPDGSAATIADYFNGGVKIVPTDGNGYSLSGLGGKASYLTVFYDVNYKPSVASIGRSDVFNSAIVNYTNKENGVNYATDSLINKDNINDYTTIFNDSPTMSKTINASNVSEDDNVDGNYPSRTMVPGEVRPVDITLNIPKGTLTNNGNDVVVTETLPDNVKYVQGSGVVHLGEGMSSSSDVNVVQNGNVIEFHLGKSFTNAGADSLHLTYNAYLDNKGNDGDVKTVTTALNYDGNSVSPISTSVVEHDPTVTTKLTDNGPDKLSSGSTPTYSLTINNTGLTTAYNTNVALGLTNLSVTSVKDSEGNVYAVKNGSVYIPSIGAGKTLVLSIDSAVSSTLSVNSNVEMSTNTTWTSVPSGDGMKTYSDSQSDTKETPPFLTATKIGGQLISGPATIDKNTTFSSNLKSYSEFYEGGVHSSNDAIGNSSGIIGTVSIPAGINNNVHVIITVPKGLDINSPIFGNFISENGIQSADTSDGGSFVNNSSNQVTGTDVTKYDAYHEDNWLNLAKKTNIMRNGVSKTQNEDGSTTVDIDVGSLKNVGASSQAGLFVFSYMSRALNTPENVAGTTLTTNYRITYDNQPTNDNVNTSVVQTIIEPKITTTKVVSSIDQKTGTITYTDTLTNTGDARAYDVFLNDKFGSGYDSNSFSSITQVGQYLEARTGWIDGVTHDDTGLTVKLNDLDAGQSFTYSYSVKLQSTTALSSAGLATTTWDSASKAFMVDTFDVVLNDYGYGRPTPVDDFDGHWVWSIPTDERYQSIQDAYGSSIYTPRDGSGQLPQDNYVSTSQAGVGLMSGNIFDTLGRDITKKTGYSTPLSNVGVSINSSGSQTQSGGVSSSTTTGSDGSWSLIVANGTGNLTLNNVPSGETLVYNSLSPDSSNKQADNNLTVNSNLTTVDHVFEKENEAPTLQVTGKNTADNLFADANFDDKNLDNTGEVDSSSDHIAFNNGFVVQRYINGTATPFVNDTFSIKNINGITTDSSNNVYFNGDKVGSFTMQNGVFTFTYSAQGTSHNNADYNKTVINSIIDNMSYSSPDLNGGSFVSRDIGVTAFDGNDNSITSQNGTTGDQGTGGNKFSNTLTSTIHSSQSENSIRGINGNFTFVEPNDQPAITNQVHILGNIVVNFDKGGSGASVFLYGLQEDALVIDQSKLGGLTANISPDGKMLTLSGNASSDVYQTALRSIGFVDNSDTPNTTYNRQVNVSITDTNNVTLQGLTGNINVTASDDSPILTGNGTSNNTIETHTGVDGQPSQNAGTSTSQLIGSFTDPDGNNAHDSATVTNDGVVISHVDVTHGSYWYTTDGGNTWTEFASKNNPYDSSKSALRLEINDNTKIAFVPTDVNYNGLVQNAVQYRIWDRSDGTQDGLGSPIPSGDLGTGINTSGAAYSSAEGTTGIMVNNLNNAPIATGNSSLNDTENLINGHTVSDTVKNYFNDSADQQYSSSNPYGSVANNLAGIAITGMTTSTYGHWAFLNSNNQWQTITGVSDHNALILSKDTVIKFIPDIPNYNGQTPVLTARVIDDSNINNMSPSTLNGTFADVTNNGGSTSISSNTMNIVDVVASVHQGPDATIGSLQNEENERLWYPNSINNLFSQYFNDNRDNQFDATNNPLGTTSSTFSGIVITGNAASSEGQWQYQDSHGNWNNIGNVSDTNALVLSKDISIRFLPTQTTYPGQDSSQAAGFNGIARPLTIKLYDSAATFSSGSHIDATANSNYVSPQNIMYSEKVDALNNAPYQTGNYTSNVSQGSNAPAINVSDMSSTFTDVNDNQKTDWNPTGTVANGFAGIAITGNPADARGVWQYKDNSGNWSNIGNVSDTNALVLDNTAQLRFVTVSNIFNGQASQLTYRVIDNSGNNITPTDTGTYTDVSNNGGMTSVSYNTGLLVQNITHINHAPVVTNGDVTFAQQGDENEMNGPSEKVSDLVGTVFNDVLDNQNSNINPTGSTANILTGVAITGNNTPASEGQWQYQDSNGNWNNVGNVSDSNALIVLSSTSLRFQPTENFNGIPSPLTTRLIENSSNFASDHNGTYTDVSNNGGTTSISAGTVNIHQSVKAENTAPVASNGNASFKDIDEIHSQDDINKVPSNNVQAVFGSHFDDSADNQKNSINPTGSTANNFAGIAITGNNTPTSEGSWQYQDSNGNWKDIGSVSDSNALILGKGTNVRFMPTENFNGSPEPLTVHVIDDSGSVVSVGANDASYQDIHDKMGGESSVSANTIDGNVHVTSENNSPVVVNGNTVSLTDTQGNIKARTISDIVGNHFDDSADNQRSSINPDGSVANNLAGVIASSPDGSFGKWKYQDSNGNWNEIPGGNGTYLSKDTLIKYFPILTNIPEGSEKYYSGTGSTLQLKLVDDSSTDFNNDDHKDGTSPISVDSLSVTETVTPVYQRPIASGSYQLEEDEHGNFSIGVSQASIFYKDNNYTYDENNNPYGMKGYPLAALAITGNSTPASEGSWQYQDNNGNWQDIGNVSDSNALMISKDSTLRFKPAEKTYPGQDASQDAGFNGISQPLSFRVINNTATVENGKTINVADYYNSISDGTASITMKVDSINNAPYVTGDASVNSTQNSEPTIIHVNDEISKTFTDSNDNQRTDDNPTGSLANNFAGIAITNNPDTSFGTWQYRDASGNWTNVGSVSENNALIIDKNSDLRFEPSHDFNGHSPSLTYKVIDDSGSTINPTANAFHADVSNSGGATSVSLNSGELVDNVIHVNHAPVASDKNVSFDTQGDEDKTDGPSETVGGLVSKVFTDNADNQRSQDNPYGSVPNTLSGVAVIKNPQTSEGNWQYQDSNGNWNNIGNVSDNGALILSKDTNIRFVPSEHYNGSPEPLEVRLIDSTYTINNGVEQNVDVTNNGGSTAIGADIVNINQTVKSENNAPISTGNGTMDATYEDKTNPKTVSDIFSHDFSDPIDNQKTDINPDGSVSNNFAGVAITSNNTPASEGQWQYQDSHGNWNNIGNVSDTNALILGKDTNIRFQPVENFNGRPSPIEAHLIDDSGSVVSVDANGSSYQDIHDKMGGRSSISENTSTVNQDVISVNNAPVVNNYSGPAKVVTTENGSVITTARDLFEKNYDDSADNQKSDINPTGSVASPFGGIAITSIDSSRGTWAYQDANNNWHDITNVSTTNALVLGRDTNIRYTPNTDFNGADAGITAKLVSNYGNTVDAISATTRDSTYDPTGIFSAGSVQTSVAINPITQPPVIDGDAYMGKGNHLHPAIVTADALLSGYNDDRNNSYNSVTNPTGTKGYPDGGIVIMGVDQNTRGVWTYTLNNHVYSLPENLSPEHALILPKSTVFTFTPDIQSQGVAGLKIAGYAANPNIVFVNGRTGAEISSQGVVENADVTHTILLSNTREYIGAISKSGNRPMLTGVTLNDFGYHRSPYAYTFNNGSIDIGNMAVGRKFTTSFMTDSINDITVPEVYGYNEAHKADGGDLPSWLTYDNKTHSFHGSPSDGDTSVDVIISIKDGDNIDVVPVHISIEQSPIQLAVLWNELGMGNKEVEKHVPKTHVAKKHLSFHRKAQEMLNK